MSDIAMLMLFSFSRTLSPASRPAQVPAVAATAPPRHFDASFVHRYHFTRMAFARRAPFAAIDAGFFFRAVRRCRACPCRASARERKDKPPPAFIR